MKKLYLQANDQQDLVEWISALNNATKITVSSAPSHQSIADLLLHVVAWRCVFSLRPQWMENYPSYHRVQFKHEMLRMTGL